MDELASVSDFIVRKTSTSPRKVKPEFRLFEDLGIDGDDLLELMEEFFQYFGVNPAGYEHARYVNPEGFWIFGRRGPPTIPISVYRLATAVNRKRWQPDD